MSENTARIIMSVCIGFIMLGLASIVVFLWVEEIVGRVLRWRASRRNVCPDGADRDGWCYNRYHPKPNGDKPERAA